MGSTALDLLKKRNNPEYLNWLAVGEALITLCDGLQHYAERKMKDFHSSLVKKLGGVTCTCSYTLGMKPNPHSNPTTSSCMWAKEIGNFHTIKKKKLLPWHQSDSNKWHDPVDGYWEVAKIFMADLGSNCSDVKDPSSTDLTGILNLMNFCKHFNVQRHLLKSVKGWRNKWAHASKHQLSEPDKQLAFKEIDNLTNDVELMSCREVQECRPTIEKVRLADISIMQGNELRVLEELRHFKECEMRSKTLEMRQKRKQVDRELKTLKEIIKSIKSINVETEVQVAVDHPQNHHNISDIDINDIPAAILLTLWQSLIRPLMKKSSRLLFFFLLIGIFVSQVGDKTDVGLDGGCSRSAKKSPISHFHYQKFNFSSYLAYKRENFFGRKWFFKELEDIFERGRGLAGVLIIGEPGSGKSALVSQLICSPYSSMFIHNNIIGYHLCDYSEKGKRNGGWFVRNLVDQIAGSIPEYSEHVANNEQLRRELSEQCEIDPTGCFYSTIVGPLRELKNQPDSLRYILMDALDECLEEDGKTSPILDIVNSKISHFPKWLKIILTSRNLTAVTTKIPRTVERIPLDPTDERSVEDIRSYIKHFLSQNLLFMDRLLDAMSLKSTTEGINSLINELTESGEGNFLFLKKTLEFMNESDGIINFQSFPTSLYDMYKAYFIRYFGEQDFRHFKGLFEVLLAAGSPLHFNEIGSILKLQNQTQEVLKLIQQVSFFMRYGQDGTVRIYHQSFAEWLVIQTNDADGFSISKSQGHQYIADFLLDGIRQVNTNLTFKELSELSMHVLSGGTVERHKRALEHLNVSGIRDPRNDRYILHELAMKAGSFSLLEIFLRKFVSADIPDMEGKTPAFYAASKGIVENLKVLIDRGANVNYMRDNLISLDPMSTLGQNSDIEDICSLMHIAAYNGHAKIVELLLNNNILFLRTRPNVPTPLHLAAGKGFLEIVKLLYNSGAKADIISLHHAAARNHSAVVQFLLETAGVIDECLPCKPGNLDFSQNVTVEEFHNFFCETALHAAVSRRHIGIVKLLLTRFGRASLECKHHSKKTPLMDAVERNDADMLDLLLNAGANVEAVCSGDETSRESMLCAAFSSYKNGFLYTVDCEKDYCPCGNKAIHLCGRYGLWWTAVVLFQKWNASILDKNCDGETALTVAVRFDQGEFIHHVNRTLRLDEGQLHAVIRLALRCGSVQVLKIISYNNRQSVNEKIRLIRVVFWSPYPNNAAFRSCSQVLKDDYHGFLIEKINNEAKKRIATVKLITQSQKNILALFLNIVDKNGKTALHYAAWSGFADAVKYLVQHGSNVTIRNHEGKTPLNLAFDLSPIYPPVFTHCYRTIDGVFTVCSTTTYDETVGYLIWSQRSNIQICDAESAEMLKIIIFKRMPLSLYSLLKIGVDKNCSTEELTFRPFLIHLNFGGEQISEVFKIFEIDVSVECGVPFRGSELHLMAYSSGTDNVGNFFKSSVNNKSFPLQRLIKSNPKGYRIFDECRDAEGYLAIHRAAQGGNIYAIEWFISIGVDILKKTSSGLTAFDLSIFYIGPIPRSKTFSSLDSLIPLTNTKYRRHTFEKLLVKYFMTVKYKRSTFQCDSTFEGFSPLHIAALRGVRMLKLVYEKAHKILPRLPLDCTNKHWILPLYLAYFQRSVESMKSNSNRTLPFLDWHSNGPFYEYPDREAEYHIMYNFFYKSPSEIVRPLYQGLLNLYPVEVSQCPGFYEILPKRKTVDKMVTCYSFLQPNNEESNDDERNSETSTDEESDNEETNIDKANAKPSIQSALVVRKVIQPGSSMYIRLDPQRSTIDKFIHDCYCAIIMQHLQRWFLDEPRENRKVSQFIAERMGWNDISADGDVRDRWPFYFLYKKAMDDYKAYKYIEILNEALELNDNYYYYDDGM